MENTLSKIAVLSSPHQRDCQGNVSKMEEVLCPSCMLC
jgi:hypothetical protein